MTHRRGVVLSTLCLVAVTILTCKPGMGQPYPFRPLDSVFGELRMDMKVGKIPDEARLLSMGFSREREGSFVIKTASGELRAVLVGPRQNIVMLAWNPAEGTAIASPILSSLLARAVSVEPVATDRLQVTLSETHGGLVMMQQSLTIGLDGKLYATLVQAAAP